MIRPPLTRRCPAVRHLQYLTTALAGSDFHPSSSRGAERITWQQMVAGE